MHVNILHLHPEAKTPTYATDGAACMDLYACEDATVPSGHSNAIRTGIGIAMPPGWSLDILSRSGLAFRHGVTAFPGIVDSDFRGEILVLLRNSSSVPYHVKAGDRIAQARPGHSPRVIFWRVEQLQLTERGAAGFGSSGL